MNCLKYIYKTKTKSALSALVLVFFVCGLLGMTASYTAASGNTLDGLRDAANTGYEAELGEEETNEDPGIITDIPSALGRIIGAVLAFTGTLFFVLMIYGGLLWMLARGNEQQVEKAKNLITAAVIGLVIILSAYAITAHIGGALTG